MTPLEVLEMGGVVAAPTESFFGLLCDAMREDALDALFALKPRADKGVPLLLPSRDAWGALVREVPEAAARLAAALWPGPLTIALEASPRLSSRLCEGGRVAVRLPGPCPAAELASAFGRPLTATSANAPGVPPAPTSELVRRAFRRDPGELLVIDGECLGSTPSTVVAVTGRAVTIVREGAVSRAALLGALGDAGDLLG